MKSGIRKPDWTGFFGSLSKRRFEWLTKVEVLKSDLGDQVLTEGLPFNGITVEKRGVNITIDISVGENTDAFFTHLIKDPASVEFVAAFGSHGDIVNIEETDGTKTLIQFIEPMGIVVGYTEIESISVTA